MTNLDIQPWGRAPTPLLPTSLVAELGSMVRRPSFLVEAVGSNATLADLCGPIWEHIDSVSDKNLKELISLIRPFILSFSHLSVRAGEPLRLPVQGLPLSNRTRNCVLKNQELFTAKRLTYSDVMSVSSFGARCAIELACVVEAAVESLSNNGIDGTLLNAQASSTTALQKEINSTFSLLAAYAAGEKNVLTLAEVLPVPLDNWPPEIKNLWESLGQINTNELAGDHIRRYSVPELMSQALAPIDTRSLEILTERVLVTERAVTLNVLGERMGITRERVRQIEKKAISFLDGLQLSNFRPIVRRADALQKKLGVGLPADHVTVTEALDWAVEDFDENSNMSLGFVRALLMWLAGPYKNRHGWLLAERHLRKRTLDAILERRNDRGIVTNEAIEEVLSKFGFIQSVHKLWLASLSNFLPVDGGHIHVNGSIPEKARTLIKFHNRPIAIEEILDLLGSGSMRSVKQRLISDSGFWRINRQSEFVLAGTPGYDEYTGITDEIIQEIEACGGEAKFDHVVEKLVRVYGVKENSVVAYINTPMFTKDENGIVRVRDSDVAIDVTTDITRTAACYRDSDGTWMWRVLVDKDVARGSGKLVPNAFAQEVGCGIGDKIETDTTEGPLTFSWQLASTTGASIGSLRSALVACEAELGDYLFVCASAPEMKFKCLSKDKLDAAKSPLERLSLLVGAGVARDDSDAERRISTALGIAQQEDSDSRIEIRRVLNSRGESELAEMIPQPDLSMDDYVSNMGKLFDK